MCLSSSFLSSVEDAIFIARHELLIFILFLFMHMYMYLCWVYATYVMYTHRGWKLAGVTSLCEPHKLHARYWIQILLIKLNHLFSTSDTYFVTSLSYSFCSSIMLFLSLWPCSWIWGHKLWCLQLCSFYWGLLYLLAVFQNSSWTLGYFLFLWWGCIKPIVHF